MTQLTHFTKRLQAVPFRERRLPWRSARATMLLVSLTVVPANGANELTLNVVNGPALVRPGDVIAVTLDVAGLTVPINAIQAFVHYDTNVLRLVDVLGNDNVGTGWTAITEDRGGGDFLQLLVMLGGETAIDHTAATLTFEAVGVGSTTVTFLADEPPLRTKLMVAADAAPILPLTLESEEIVVAAATATFTPVGPTTVSAGTDVVFTVSVASPSGFDAADIVLGSNDATDLEFVYSAAWATAFSTVTTLFFDNFFYTQDLFAGGNNATSVGTSMVLGTLTIKTAGMANGTYEVKIDHTVDGGVSALWLASVKDLLSGSASFSIGCLVSADCDDGLFCNGTETCVVDTCTPGTAPDCSGAADQCNVGVCNEATGACDPQPTNEGLGCDDGRFCTLTDVCSGGTCIGGGDPCPGQSCDETAGVCFNCTINSDCVDASICTLDLCIGGMCQNTATNEGVPCADGEACLVGETCQLGICTGGIAPDCSAFDDQCNIASCDGLGSEGNCDALTPANEGFACADGNPCNVGETCQLGVCAGGALPDCSGTGDQCNADSTCDPLGAEGNCDTAGGAINEAFACNDGSACLIGETCQSGACTGGTAPDCSGTGDQCNANSTCDPLGAEGNCDTAGGAINEAFACNDGSACLIGETCQSGACTGGTAPDCSGAGDPCNSASCDVLGFEGNCDTLTPANEGFSCDDGLFCNGTETCVVGACTPGTAPDCSGASDQCNVGVCNEATDACDPQPSNEGLSCDDGRFCTTGETCTTGVCNGTATDCSGLTNQCNTGVCNETLNLCEAQPVPDGTTCADADPCTESDVCTSGSCGGVNVPRITITVAVEGLAPAVSVAREVTSTMTVCAGPATDTRVVQETFDASGLGTVILENVDPSAAWINVREAHSLSRVKPLVFAACNQATVSLTGLDRLAIGDVSGDGFVDIEDISVLALRWNAAGSQADLNGDGQQNSADLMLFLANILLTGDAPDGCVP